VTIMYSYLYRQAGVMVQIIGYFAFFDR